MRLSVDVVIPTYNGWKLTRSCLTHLEQQTLPHSVIVADNGSHDGTPERVRDTFSNVEVVEIGVNDEAVGSASALLVVPHKQLIDSVGLAVDKTLAGFPRLRGRPAGEAPTEKPALVGPSGGAGAYRRSAWEAVGGLDENVFGYLEDLDLALRLQSGGWKAAAAPTAVGVHHGSATMRKRSAWQRKQAGFSRGYFLRRYGVLQSRASARALFTEAVVIAGDLVIERDLVSLRARINGWRVASAEPRHPYPPNEAIDSSITLVESLRLRLLDVRTAPA
jgi:N-acetylglucosaminyl-diphospho-decaprenol L-rhamnosyltransferase